MTEVIKATAIIRQRGQLTLPENIRSVRKWASSDSVVTIISDKYDEIVIRPHYSQKELDWEKLWKQIKRVRSFKGKGKPVSLSKFIAKDRVSGHSI